MDKLLSLATQFQYALLILMCLLLVKRLGAMYKTKSILAIVYGNQDRFCCAVFARYAAGFFIIIAIDGCLVNLDN